MYLALARARAIVLLVRLLLPLLLLSRWGPRFLVTLSFALFCAYPRLLLMLRLLQVLSFLLRLLLISRLRPLLRLRVI